MEDGTSDQARPFISTTEARKLAGCSTNFMVYALTHNLLEGFKTLQGKKRLVWKVYQDSLDIFIATHIAKSRHVGPLYKHSRKRGTHLSRGYRQIFQPTHHRSDCNGYVPEHILVMEKHLGRKIISPEQVHHIDGNKLNNKPSNLKVYASMSEHLKKGHSADYKARITLRRLFANPTKKLLQLPIEKQAEYFRMLVNSECK